MIVWLKLVLLLLIFWLMSWLNGYALLKATKMEKKLLKDNEWSHLLIPAAGCICCICMFSVCSIVFAFAGIGLFWLVTVWAVLLCAFIAITLICCRQIVFSDLHKFLMVPVRDFFAVRERTVWFFRVAVFLLIILQIYTTSAYSFHQPNVTRQIYSATLAYETGKLTAQSPIMMLWAGMSIVLCEHPLVVILSYSPFMTLPLFYMVYSLTATMLCKKQKVRQLMLLLFMCILHIFGFQSGYALNLTLLFSYFSGEAFILQGISPLVLWLVLFIRESMPPGEQINDKNASGTEEDWEEEDMKKHRIVNARNVGIALVLFVVLAAGAIYILNNKINSLHNATQNLQIAMDEKCSLYEFKPKNDGAVQGYLLKQSDGSLVMIGGGSEENGEELYAFLTKYGANLDQWYLYGDTDKEKGAYEYCVKDKEIPVGKVYYLTGMKEVN